MRSSIFNFSIMSSSILRLTVAVVVLGSALPAAGQSTPVSTSEIRPRYAGGVVAGASQFDLSGTGTTAFLSARLEAELRRWLVAEAALNTFRPVEQFGRQARYTVPEAQLQLQVPGRVIRPYLGAGGGFVFAGDGQRRRGTASGAAGLRVALPGGRLDARGELRARGIGRYFSGSTTEWTAGIGYRF